MQSCHSCTRHSVLTCSIILPSIVKTFLTVAELCSGNKLLRPPTDIHHFYNQCFPTLQSKIKLIKTHEHRAVLGGAVEVVNSNLARFKNIFSALTGIINLLDLSIYMGP